MLGKHVALVTVTQSTHVVQTPARVAVLHGIAWRSIVRAVTSAFCARIGAVACCSVGAAMPKHLSLGEQAVVDKVTRQKNLGPMDAMRAVNKLRKQKGHDELNKSTIYRYLKGKTHRRGLVESRGRKKSLGKRDVLKLDQARKRLLKAADSRRRITYEDISKEAGYYENVTVRRVADALRAQGVRFRAPRKKVLLTDADAKVRLQTAKEWVKRPASFWSEGVHAYVDNKAFPVPLTPQQRAKYEKTRVTGHLRKAEEGVKRGFVKPRMKHSFLGIPSVTISAAVAKDRVIMWSVVDKTWNGTAAASMYRGPLAKALRQTWGEKRRYTIVEDGDRKGNQSGLGIAAKEEMKIKALTLPPRTPAWMPLDFAVWKAIEDKMHSTAPKGRESQEEYLTRLRQRARSLPRGFVRKVIGRMKDNIQGVIEAGGYHAKDD